MGRVPDEKFDPEKITRGWTQLVYGETGPNIVDAKDYDSLLELYRLYKRAFEMSIVDRLVDMKFDNECEEADYWLKLAKDSLQPPIMVDMSSVTLTGWDKSFVLEAVYNYIKGQDVGTLAKLPDLLTRLQQTDMQELKDE